MHEQVPWAGVIIVAVTMVGGALLVHQVVRRASDGRLRRNDFAGIRTPSTMANESAWIAGHRAARRATDLGAGGMGLTGVIVLGLRDPWPFLITTLSGAMWVLFWVFVSARQAGKAARSASDIT
ncbi:SdpI family protein [Haloactinomyces albus]|uniref:SdpI/YhfL protein family protein n=1 Tax=Haloactinomyces albus TaxID=1352928 RepID=A0AAE3ZB22_9ACTN|nr:SdpI family protein [Haloactinomyces albus]MDR7300443.1 hypothetical protein [Haloactinomyces albus]